MKVLLVHPSFYFYGGAEIAIVKLVNELTKRGNTVDILTTCLIPDIKDDMQFNQLFIEDNYDGMRKKLNDILDNYDVVNFHNHPVELLLDRKFPSVWFCNEPSDDVLDGKKIDPVERQKVKDTISSVLVSDNKNAQRFNNTYGFAAKQIPYGTDWEFWSNDVPNRRRWKNDGYFTIVHSAAIHRRKNQMETVKTFVKLRETIPKIKLYLAGMVMDFEYLTEIVNYAKENKVPYEDIIVTGMMTREDLRSLFHSADILFHPIGNQGGWLTPLDAIATGLYPIVSEESNIAPILKKMYYGMVSKPENYIASIDALRCEEPIPFDAVQETIKLDYSWDKYTDRVIRELQRVCKK